VTAPVAVAVAALVVAGTATAVGRYLLDRARTRSSSRSRPETRSPGLASMGVLLPVSNDARRPPRSARWPGTSGHPSRCAVRSPRSRSTPPASEPEACAAWGSVSAPRVRCAFCSTTVAWRSPKARGGPAACHCSPCRRARRRRRSARRTRSSRATARSPACSAANAGGRVALDVRDAAAGAVAVRPGRLHAADAWRARGGVRVRAALPKRARRQPLDHPLGATGRRRRSRAPC
jgi:hypothetical protein